MKIKEISYQESRKFQEFCNLLLITATQVERKEVLKALRPLNGEGVIYKVYKDTLTYYIGTFGEYCAVLVKSGMGIGRAGGAIMTTRTAIEVWRPKAVVMIGIAFGVDPQSQRVGDVLISEQIIPYDVRREGDSLRIYRSERPAASPYLANRFTNDLDWHFPLPDGTTARLILGPLLSGEALIDNKSFRDSLLQEFPHAKGGDMEATGVYVAASDQKIDWIVVKAICDFADGMKKVDKSARQLLAIQSAVSLSHAVFSSKYAFEDMGLVRREECQARSVGVEEVIQHSVPLSEKVELRSWIAERRFSEVFIRLRKILESEDIPQYLNELVTIQQDYNSNRKGERVQTIAPDFIRQRDNQISLSLLELVDRL